MNLKDEQYWRRTCVVKRSERISVSKRRINAERVKFGNQNFVLNSFEDFQYVHRHSQKDLSKYRNEEDQRKKKDKK